MLILIKKKGGNVMGSMRKNYSAALKVNVALAALKGDKNTGTIIK
jgi:hypothetical protein